MLDPVTNSAQISGTGASAIQTTELPVSSSLSQTATITTETVPVAVPQPEIVPVTGTANPDYMAVQEWQAQKDETLRHALTEWSQRVGVSLVWSSEYDYPLQTDLRIKAAYPDAVRTLLAGFSKAQPRPLGRLFKNAQVGAAPVLIIETQRLTN